MPFSREEEDMMFRVTYHVAVEEEYEKKRRWTPDFEERKVRDNLLPREKTVLIYEFVPRSTDLRLPQIIAPSAPPCPRFSKITTSEAPPNSAR